MKELARGRRATAPLSHAYLDAFCGRPIDVDVPPPETNRHALTRLAQLLRRRYGRETGRAFVVLAVSRDRGCANSDEMATQQMPVIRAAR